MSDIRQSTLPTAVWIPLRAVHHLERTGKYGLVCFKSDFFGAGSIAVPVENKDDANVARLGSLTLPAHLLKPVAFLEQRLELGQRFTITRPSRGALQRNQRLQRHHETASTFEFDLLGTGQ
jgi:hypothetical protein